MKKTPFILVGLALIFLTGCAEQAQITPEKNVGENVQPVDYSQFQSKMEKKAEKIDIVLFHATQRCYSCNMMEELTKKTLEENFKADVDAGKITFQAINAEDPVNTDIVTRYGATGLSIFINGITDGKDMIQEEQDLWRYIQNEAQFKEYLTKKLSAL